MFTKKLVFPLMLAGSLSAQAQTPLKVETDTVIVVRTVTISDNKKDTTFTMTKDTKAVVDGYKKIENGVVKGYTKIQDGTVKGYTKFQNGIVKGWTKIENKFVDILFRKDGETTEEAKARLS